MLIHSPHEKTSVELERTDCAEYRQITVTACVKDIKLCVSTWFFDCDHFLACLTSFEATRSGRARLQSDEFELDICAANLSGSAWVSFRIKRLLDLRADAPKGAPNIETVCLESSIRLPGEYVPKLLRDFRELLRI